MHDGIDQAIVLSPFYIIRIILQGITEFLPVSSSTHLLFMSKIMHAPIIRDDLIQLHFGTLVACLAIGAMHVKRDIKSTLKLLAIANIPMFFFPVFVHVFRINFNDTWDYINIGAFALPLIHADICYAQNKNFNELSYKQVLIIGIAQSFAVIPGISRLGICITVMRYMGIHRKEAYFFGMMLSIVPVAGALVLSRNLYSFNIYTILCGIIGYCTYHIVRRLSIPFWTWGIYRIIICIVFLYTVFS